MSRLIDMTGKKVEEAELEEKGEELWMKRKSNNCSPCWNA